jgi:hypothetical protein
MIARESITTNVKQRDVDLALEILGVSAEEAAGKTVRKKTKIKRTEVQMSMEKEQIMYADVFNTCGKSFLLAIFEPSHIVFTDHLPSDANHTTEEIIASMKRMITQMANRSFVVTEKHFDGEARHGTFTGLLGLIIHPPGQHVGRAERAIRNVKETLRCICGFRPWFPWGGETYHRGNKHGNHLHQREEYQDGKLQVITTAAVDRQNP